LKEKLKYKLYFVCTITRETQFSFFSLKIEIFQG